MKIDSYQIQYFAGSNKAELKAFIWLFDEKNDSAGDIKFYNNPDHIPPQDTMSHAGFISCHLTADRYAEVVDLLRNEGPIFLHFSETQDLAYLSTAAEPVGEGELHHIYDKMK